MIRRKLYEIYTYKGFTLAEVLITLGIIGIIAAITIPSLIKNTQETEYKIAYRKAYSVATQAFLSANQQNLMVSRENATLPANKMANFAAFKSQFNVAKDCNSGDNSDCWAAGETFYTTPASSLPSFIDNSGMSWSMYTSAGWDGMLLDTNGFKKPNKYGYDRFYFFVFDSNNNGQNGIPIKISPHGDINSYDASVCPSGNVHPCLYTTWLFKNQ